MTNVCITIDTEGDSANNPHSTVFGIEIILPKLLTLFAKYDIKATFFVQEDEICKIASTYTNLLKSLENKGHEIGYHAHGLIRASQEKKNYILTKGIQRLKKLGFNPISFRAGRYHLSCSLLRILEKNKIEYDSSVVPGLRESLSDGTLRYDHTGAPHKPYYLSYENHWKQGNSRILELPINRYPYLPPTTFGGVLTGAQKNEEILFDYFYKIRKDKLIVIVLHTWDGLSLFKRFIRGEKYHWAKRFTLELMRKTNDPKLLTNSAYLNRLDNFLKYISENKDAHPTTIKEAGQTIAQTMFG